MSVPLTRCAICVRRISSMRLINFLRTWGEQRHLVHGKGFVANGMRTVCGWRSTGSHFHPHIRTFGSRTIRRICVYETLYDTSLFNNQPSHLATSIEKYTKFMVNKHHRFKLFRTALTCNKDRIYHARETVQYYWEAKDQWRATIDFDVLGMVDYNIKGNIGIRRLHYLR